MLDKHEKTQALLEQLKLHMPFRASLPKSTVAFLKKQKAPLPTTVNVSVTNVSYAGDEGGILCYIYVDTPENGKAKQTALVLSITHISIHPKEPFSKEVLAYQKHRVKKLRQQDSFGAKYSLIK